MIIENNCQNSCCFCILRLYRVIKKWTLRFFLRNFFFYLFYHQHFPTISNTSSLLNLMIVCKISCLWRISWDIWINQVWFREQLFHFDVRIKNIVNLQKPSYEGSVRSDRINRKKLQYFLFLALPSKELRT